METERLYPVIHSFFRRVSYSDWALKETKADHAILTYVLQGGATYTIDQKPHALRAGELCFIAPGQVYQAAARPDDPMTCYVLAFFPNALDGAQAQLPFAPVAPIGMAEELIALFERLDYAWLKREPGYEQQTQALLMLILHHVRMHVCYPQCYENLDPRIRKAVDYILANFTQPITVQGLAKIIGLNPVYFGTLFREETGQSLKDYLNQIRTNRAENLLASGEYLIHQIATLCGFSDTFYFSKVYKRIKGVCPSKDQRIRA